MQNLSHQPQTPTEEDLVKKLSINTSLANPVLDLLQQTCSATSPFDFLNSVGLDTSTDFSAISQDTARFTPATSLFTPSLIDTSKLDTAQLSSAINLSSAETVTSDEKKEETPGNIFPNETKQHQVVFVNDQQTPLFPEIHALGDKGFFKLDDYWGCYRRNYFQLSAGFSLLDMRGRCLPNSEYSCYIVLNNVKVPVSSFSINMRAEDEHDKSRIKLVQHTTKRDKGPQWIPKAQKCPVGGKISKYYRYKKDPRIVTFERIQFKSSTSITKRNSRQHFVLVFELYADIQNGNRVLIAESFSSPLVVRGKSASHYEKELRSKESSRMSSPYTPAFQSSLYSPSICQSPLSQQWNMASPALSDLSGCPSPFDLRSSIFQHRDSEVNVSSPMSTNVINSLENDVNKMLLQDSTNSPLKLSVLSPMPKAANMEASTKNVQKEGSNVSPNKNVAVNPVHTPNIVSAPIVLSSTSSHTGGNLTDISNVNNPFNSSNLETTQKTEKNSLMTNLSDIEKFLLS